MASPSVAVESTLPQAEDEWIRQSCGFYACPACKQDLEPLHDGLSCRVCARTYPILSGIPDFILVNLEESSNRSLRAVGKKDSRPMLDFLASAYESCVYPLVCNLYGGWHSTSLKQLAHDVSDIVRSRDGVILDAACGPGTYGRRIASASRTVLGIDICISCGGAPIMSNGDMFPTFTSPVLRWRLCRFGLACSTPPSVQDR